jgi:hypothetical protein
MLRPGIRVPSHMRRDVDDGDPVQRASMLAGRRDVWMVHTYSSDD